MIRVQYIGCLMISLFLAVSCSENPSSREGQEPAINTKNTINKANETSAEVALETTNEPLQNTEEFPVLYFQGTLGEWPISMQLFRIFNTENENVIPYTGIYSYDHIGVPINLRGEFSDGVLMLNEETKTGKSHLFKGQLTEESYTGKWLKNDYSSEFAVQLNRVNNQNLSFNQKIFRDSIVSIKDLENSPQAHFSYVWLVPQSTDTALSLFLNQALQGVMKGRDKRKYESLTAIVHEQRNRFSETYQTTVKDFLIGVTADTLEVLNDVLRFYEESIDMEIWLQNEEFLTVGLNGYAYTGGAHGMYDTELASFDLKKRKRITLEHIFLPGFEEKVSELLTAAVRTKFELAKDEPVSSIIDTEIVPLNNNFGISQEAIFFLYNPYEIAPYAAGQITLEVAFSKLTDVLKPDWIANLGLN